MMNRFHDIFYMLHGSQHKIDRNPEALLNLNQVTIAMSALGYSNNVQSELRNFWPGVDNVKDWDEPVMSFHVFECVMRAALFNYTKSTTDETNAKDAVESTEYVPNIAVSTDVTAPIETVCDTSTISSHPVESISAPVVGCSSESVDIMNDSTATHIQFHEPLQSHSLINGIPIGSSTPAPVSLSLNSIDCSSKELLQSTAKGKEDAIPSNLSKTFLDSRKGGREYIDISGFGDSFNDFEKPSSVVVQTGPWSFSPSLVEHQKKNKATRDPFIEQKYDLLQTRISFLEAENRRLLGEASEISVLRAQVQEKQERIAELISNDQTLKKHTTLLTINFEKERLGWLEEMKKYNDLFESVSQSYELEQNQRLNYSHEVDEARRDLYKSLTHAKLCEEELSAIVESSDSLRADLAKTKQERDELKNSLDDASIHRDCIGKIEKLMAELGVEKKLHGDLHLVCQQLNGKLAEATAELVACRAEGAERDIRYDKLSRLVNDKTEARAAAVEAEGAQKLIANLRRQLKACEGEVVALSRRVEITEEACSTSRRETDHCRDKTAEAQKETNMWKKKAETVNTEILSTRKKLTEAEAKIQHSNSSLASAQNEVALSKEKEKIITELQRKLFSKDKELASIGVKLVACKETLAAKLENNAIETTDLRAQLSISSKRIDELMVEHNEIETRAIELIKDLANTRANCSQLTGSLGCANKEIDRLRSDLYARAQENTEHINGLAKADEELTYCRSKLADAEQLVLALKKDVESLTIEREELIHRESELSQRSSLLESIFQKDGTLQSELSGVLQRLGLVVSSARTDENDNSMNVNTMEIRQSIGITPLGSHS